MIDPACKTGVFLREIAKRLIKGLEPQMPDLQERIDHIFHKQLFGISITELTSLLSRRGVYCSKYPNSEYSVTRFDDQQGNIRFKRIQHIWENGKCKYCGVAKKEGTYDREEMEIHAYEWIHTIKPEDIFNMKFDVIISNPPYQLNVGVQKENYAVPIYQKFVSQAKKLNPRFLTMIIPSRWFAGGRGLDDFRKEMLDDDHLRIIHDFPKSFDCFPGVEIQGGVCYFLWERERAGNCKVYTHKDQTIGAPMERPLLEEGCDTFIRYNEAISIIRKVRAFKEECFMDLVSPQTPFGIITSYKGTKERVSDTDLKMYISGNEKEYKGGSAYCPISLVTKGQNMIPWHKVFVCEAYGGGMNFPHSVLSMPFYGEPNTICNQSYLVVGPLKNKKECENVISYYKTRFVRFLILQKKNAQHAMRGVYQFVPKQDFSKSWTDEELYSKYKISAEEIAFIEAMVKPMDGGESDAD